MLINVRRLQRGQHFCTERGEVSRHRRRAKNQLCTQYAWTPDQFLLCCFEFHSYVGLQFKSAVGFDEHWSLCMISTVAHSVLRCNSILMHKFVYSTISHADNSKLNCVCSRFRSLRFAVGQKADPCDGFYIAPVHLRGLGYLGSGRTLILQKLLSRTWMSTWTAPYRLEHQAWFHGAHAMKMETMTGP